MSIILKTYKAKEVMEGAGVLVNRVFGYYEVKDFDPFLMLDFFSTDKETNSPGFPWHPHKGIETISYFTKGAGAHEDSMGNKGTINAGELQWMSAGRGVMHQELPAKSPNGYQGFQFWVNMPAAEKLNKPSYQYIKKGEMKSVFGKGYEVRVIAGNYENVLGPIDKADRGITMLHVLLDKDSEINIQRQSGKTAFLFSFEGQGLLDEQPLNSKTAYTLNQGTFDVKTTEEKLEFIYAEGTPLNEPIAWRGPIVMNTQQELIETFADLRNNTFIK